MKKRNVVLLAIFTGLVGLALGFFQGFRIGNSPVRVHMEMTGGPAGIIATNIREHSLALSDGDAQTRGVDEVIKRQVEHADSATSLGATLFCQMLPRSRLTTKQAVGVLEKNGYMEKWGKPYGQKARAYILAQPDDAADCVRFEKD